MMSSRPLWDAYRQCVVDLGRGSPDHRGERLGKVQPPWKAGAWGDFVAEPPGGVARRARPQPPPVWRLERLTDELRMDRDVVGLTRPLPACPAGEAVPRLRRGLSQLSVSRPLAGGPMGRQPGGGAGFSAGLAWELVHRPDKPAGVQATPWEVGNPATSRVCSTQPLSALGTRGGWGRAGCAGTAPRSAVDRPGYAASQGPLFPDAVPEKRSILLRGISALRILLRSSQINMQQSTFSIPDGNDSRIGDRESGISNPTLIAAEGRARRSRFRTAWIIVLIGLGSGLAGPLSASNGQEARARRAPAAVRELVAGLKSACESEAELRGALIQSGEPNQGALVLSGTIDRAEQVGLIEAEARRLLDAKPAWKAQFPRGVSAAKLIVFPVRSDLLARFQSGFAREKADKNARADLLQQTRIDDLYFDARGQLRWVALCINQGAYLARKNAGKSTDDDPLLDIERGIHEVLKEYPLPQGIPPKVLAQRQAEKITFGTEPGPEAPAVGERVQARRRALPRRAASTPRER